VTRAELLAELGATHHRGRIALMVALGRRHQESDVAAILQSLAGGGHYLRLMALYSVWGSGDGELVCRVAEQPSKSLQPLVRKLAVRFCSQEQCLALLSQMPRKGQRVFLALLKSRGRDDVAQAFLASQADLALELQAFASGELLETHRSSLLERGGAVEWTRLARYQPDWVLSMPLDLPRDFAQNRRLQASLLELARQQRPQALALLKAARAAGWNWDDLPCSQVCQVFPQEMAGLALLGSRHLDWGWSHQAGRLTGSLREQLLQKGWLSVDYLSCWPHLPLSEREAIWHKFSGQMEDPEGRIHPFRLRHLPRHLREAEAARQAELEVNSWMGSEALYFPLMAWEPALAALEPYLKNPDADQRALGARAYTALIRFHPDKKSQLLDWLQARANEADPVRAAFLEGLAGLPPQRWEGSDFKGLGQVLKALLAAADASARSFAQAETFLIRLLPYQPAFAASWLGRLLRHAGQSRSTSWSERATFPAELELELVAVAREWIARERYAALFGLMTHLGIRLRAFPELQKLLLQLALQGEVEAARSAFGHLRDSGAQAHCPELLASDPSWVCVPGLSNWLHRHRQDLLAPYLQTALLQGRFASGQTMVVLGFQAGFWRWTPDQQGQYAQQLDTILSDPARDLPAQLSCLRALSRMPALSNEWLKKYAALTESRQAVRDYALRCLARMDGQQGLDPLLEALGDERDRIAVYALRQLFLEMPASQALPKLLAIEPSRLTVAKEVLRLLGDLQDGLGVAEVERRLEGELHRDLRIAALRALWPHLDRESLWVHFEEAAALPDGVLHQSLAAIPEGHLGPAAQQWLRQLLLGLLRSPRWKTRALVLARLNGRRFEDVPENLLEVLKELLGRRREGSLASSILWSICQGRPQLWASLLRDQLPRRQALEHLVSALHYRLKFSSELLVPSLEVLAEDPATMLQQLTLRAAAGALPDFLEAVEREVLADPGCWDVVLNWKSLLVSYTYRLVWSDYAKIEQRWAQHVDPRLRRLALESLLLHVEQAGWKGNPQLSLAQFQQDHAAVVSGRAGFIFPPPEAEEQDKTSAQTE